MKFLCFHVTQQVQKDMVAAVHAGDMEVFSVAYVSGSVARHVLRGVSCDACKTCVTSEVLLSAYAFIYFTECSDTVQSLTCHSETLVWRLLVCCNSNEIYDGRQFNSYCSISQLPLRAPLTWRGLGVPVVHFTTNK
ncbi:hypothetical protein B7P43_G16203 [Cryptotermes secundus]|uniref:Uncharacterized protein n=1 Tax=Cryptotermes secundus TaxID=105785 RepID=A0A2J7PPN6_9NEOP|nr:hypothetical protein B7P43_G16203 [Cryptotermes secundus]